MLRTPVWKNGLPLLQFSCVSSLRSSNLWRPLILLFDLLENRRSMFIILALTSALLALPWTLALCGPINEVTFSFFGSPGNLPSGPDTTFDCGRGTGADGSLWLEVQNPIFLTLATSNDIPTNR